MMENKSEKDMIAYELRLEETGEGTGYFGFTPAEPLDEAAALTYLKNHPNDEFMRRYLFKRSETWKTEHLEACIRDNADEKTILSLIAEICILSGRVQVLERHFDSDRLKELANHSPLIYLRAHLDADREDQSEWIQLLGANIQEHAPLPAPEKTGLSPLPFPEAAPPKTAVPLAEVYKTLSDAPPIETPPRPSPEETAQKALGRLEAIGVIAGPEMRHEASLSPIALLRKWKVNLTVNCGRHRFRLSGKQTSYGRGIDVEPARAAYLMEMVERCSSFAGCEPDHVPGYVQPHPIIRASYSELAGDAPIALDPDTLALETPYNDQPLYWIRGEALDWEGRHEALIPVQCVFLFSNLDETRLFSGLGSTGLASGNTPEEAKVSALLEIIERHCEGVTPFDPAKCFDIETDHPRIQSLLNSYQKAGIRIQFQDLTSDLGIPCCKCFVISRDGRVIKGTGAHLNARRALLSAMTETPYPFPNGDPSGPGLEALIRVPLENLPDYTFSNAAENLRLLEKTLIMNGYRIFYTDLTRRDLGFPVVRAIIPGMEITADFSRFSRVHPQLYGNYAGMFGSDK